MLNSVSIPETIIPFSLALNRCSHTMFGTSVRTAMNAIPVSS